MTNIRILSLGAGVQSSVLALMMARGEIEPAEHAIFADTQAEPQHVYNWLDWLEAEIQQLPHPFPIHRVSAGDLGADMLAALDDPAKRCASPPFHNRNHEGKTALLWRQCTTDYKVAPIKRQIQALRQGRPVIQAIGISMDEAHRMKPARVQYITHIWPLIDLRMSRHDCLRWMDRHGYPQPPKSACYFCPYMDNRRLREIKTMQPEEWARLVWFDGEMRRRQQATINGARINGQLYVHRACIPIDQVDLSTAEDRGQRDIFGEECEGMCGL